MTGKVGFVKKSPLSTVSLLHFIELILEIEGSSNYLSLQGYLDASIQVNDTVYTQNKTVGRLKCTIKRDQ